jgi:hypothetical protein
MFYLRLVPVLRHGTSILIHFDENAGALHHALDSSVLCPDLWSKLQQQHFDLLQLHYLTRSSRVSPTKLPA